MKFNIGVIVVGVVAIVLVSIFLPAFRPIVKTGLQKENDTTNAGLTSASANYDTLTETKLTIFPVLWGVMSFLIYIGILLGMIGINIALNRKAM